MIRIVVMSVRVIVQPPCFHQGYFVAAPLAGIEMRAARATIAGAFILQSVVPAVKVSLNWLRVDMPPIRFDTPPNR